MLAFLYSNWWELEISWQSFSENLFYLFFFTLLNILTFSNYLYALSDHLDFLLIIRNSRPEVFCCLRPATLLKKRLWHRCFPVNFVKFLRTPFFIEHLWWLPLNNWSRFFTIILLVPTGKFWTKTLWGLLSPFSDMHFNMESPVTTTFFLLLCFDDLSASLFPIPLLLAFYIQFYYWYHRILGDWVLGYLLLTLKFQSS